MNKIQLEGKTLANKSSNVHSSASGQGVNVLRYGAELSVEQTLTHPLSSPCHTIYSLPVDYHLKSP
jgi:hypothetical protein